MMSFDQTQFVLLCCVGLLTAGSIMSGWRIDKLEKKNRELCKIVADLSDLHCKLAVAVGEFASEMVKEIRK